MPKRIQHHWDLEVYKSSVELAMELFNKSKSFPVEERYALTDQMRRSSRSVSAQIAEAWRRRKYEGVFVNKLNEAEGEAAESQTWIEYAVKCSYVKPKCGRDLHQRYEHLLNQLANMGNHPEKWVLKPRNS